MGWMSGAITRRWETTAAGQGGEPEGVGVEGLQRRNWNATLFTVTDFRCDCLETSNLTKRRPRPAAGSRAGTRPRHQSSTGTKIEMEDET